MKNVLVVAPHPDDETLGCGGATLKHISNSDNVYWLIMTSTNHKLSQERKNSRTDEIKQVAKLYQVKGFYRLPYQALLLDQVKTGELINSVSKIINKIEPNIIYLPFKNDIHNEHKIVFQAVMSCSKNFRYPYIERILMYETLSETEFAPALTENVFIPNVFVDISEYFEKKIEIMKIYKSEVMEEPFPRSLSTIEALARYRGSRIGVKYAEAFQLLLEIN